MLQCYHVGWYGGLAMSKSTKPSNKRIVSKQAKIPAGVAERFPHITAGRKSPVLPEINLAELARQAGMSREQVSRLVHGHNRAGIESLRRLQVALGLSSLEAVEAWLTKVSGKV